MYEIIKQGENDVYEFEGEEVSNTSYAELLRLFQQSGMFHFDLTAITKSGLKIWTLVNFSAILNDMI
ncbi:MAG: hypothetical protein IPI18_11730 [Saprospiraceae bacterium]|nr:hypothetical protein [Saprospiraceae bacterium]